MAPRLTIRERHLRGITLAATPPEVVPTDDLALSDLEEIVRRIIASDDGSPLPVSELAKMKPSRGTRIALAARETWRAMIPFLFDHAGMSSGDWIREARWDWFGTLTVSGPEPSRSLFEGRTQQWLRDVAKDASGHLVVAYVIARGRSRGRIHSHLLVGLPRGLGHAEPNRERAQSRWTHAGPGIADLQDFRTGGGACEYIANHFTGDDDTRCVVWIACPRHRICRRRSCLAAQCAFPLGRRLI